MSIKSTKGFNTINTTNRTSNIKSGSRNKVKLKSKEKNLKIKKKKVLAKNNAIKNSKVKNKSNKLKLKKQNKNLIKNNVSRARALTVRKLQRTILDNLKKSNNAESKSIEAKGLNNSIKATYRTTPEAAKTAKTAGRAIAKTAYKTKELSAQGKQKLADLVGNIKLKNSTPTNNFKNTKSSASVAKANISLKQNIDKKALSLKKDKLPLPKKQNISRKKKLKLVKDKFLTKNNKIRLRKIINSFDFLTKNALGKMIRRITSSIGLMFSPVILIFLVIFVVVSGIFGGSNSHKSSEMDLIISKSGFAVPIERPLITSRFGWRPYPLDPTKQDFHTGIDFSANFGDPVFATLAGKVKDIGVPFPDQDYGGYETGEANYIIIDHGNGIESAYWHLKSVLVKPGDVVEQGAIIGTAGSTGYSTGCHLHFEIRDYNIPAQPGAWANQIDPFPILFGTIKDKLDQSQYPRHTS